MLRILLALVLAVSAVAAQAADTAIYCGPDGKLLQPGSYWSIVLHADGSAPTVTKVLTVGNDPLPPTPTPDQLTDRAKAIKTAAEGVTSDPQRGQTAQQLAELYRQLAAKVKSGDITGQSVIAFATKYGTDNLLNGKGTQVLQAWQPVRDVFSTQWAAVINVGGSDAEFAKLLNETAAGLQASAPNEEPQIDIEMILKIIQMIMEILKLIPHAAL